MVFFKLRPRFLGLAALVALAPRMAHSGEVYTRQLRFGSGVILGLTRFQPQDGTVVIKAGGKEVGRLQRPGEFVALKDRGAYTLEFGTAAFDLNFAIMKSKTTNSAYFLNLSKAGADQALKARGGWEGPEEGETTLHEGEGQALLIMQ
jgi:hypothetical protein